MDDPERWLPRSGGAASARPVLVSQREPPGPGPVAMDDEVASLLPLLPTALDRHVRQLYERQDRSYSGKGGRRNVGHVGHVGHGGNAHCDAVCSSSGGAQLIEVVVDTGRPAVFHFDDGTSEAFDGEASVPEALDAIRAYRSLVGGRRNSRSSTASDLPFRSDNRLAVPGSLHRISAIRGADRSIIGLTYRVGRHIAGAADMLFDVLAASVGVGAPASSAGGTGRSLLLLGVPGVGKTTLLRDISRICCDVLGRRCRGC